MGTPEVFYLTINDRRLKFRWCAPRLHSHSPVIVLLHQGLGSITQWRHFPEELASRCGCAVLSFDRYGHGQSASLSGPRYLDFLDHEAVIALPAILDALNIEKPVLYGHSDGGTIALMFAAAFPRRPMAVISEAAHVFSEVESSGGVVKLVEEYRTGNLREKLERHHGRNVDEMFNGWASIWQSPAMNSWNMARRLENIITPLLLIQDEDDEHGSMAQIETIISRVRGPKETFLLRGCGHLPHLIRTEEVVSCVANFLERLD